MKKRNFFLRFNFFAITYLAISFCFLFRFPFFFNWNTLLVVELSYVTISAIFSLFILSFIATFLKKVRTGQIKRPYYFPIKLHLFHLLALAIWFVGIFFQLYYSIFGITNEQFFNQHFLVDETLNNLLIAQLSLTIYLLVFILTIFVFGIIFAKSKMIIIEFAKLRTNFFWFFRIRKAVKIEKEWFLFSTQHLLYFLIVLTCALKWTQKNLDLKIKTIESEFLKNQKKQTTPPLSFQIY